LGTSPLDLQRCSGGHRTHLFWNLLSREQIVSFNRFCAVPFSIGRPGERGYCAAYPVDIFVSASSYRDEWQKRRWVVFVIGLLFAAIITRFFALGMFHSESTGIH
jgi:hypothetical protein